MITEIRKENGLSLVLSNIIYKKDQRSNTVRKTTNRVHKLLVLFLFQVQANEAETLSYEVVKDVNYKLNTKLSFST